MVDEEQMAAPDSEAPESKDVAEDRGALVKDWVSKIRTAKKHWESVFKEMRTDMEYATHGAPKEWREKENYVVPVVARQINQAVASLYAKNPTVVAEPKKRLMSSVWDGDVKMLQAAMQNPQNPRNMQVIQEAGQVQQQTEVLNRVCKTLEILWKYYTEEQEPNFKRQLKQLVRRTKTCGVGYVMLDFQRELQPRPEVSAQIEDMTAQLQRIQRLSEEAQSGELEEDSADMHELQTMLTDLQNQEYAIVREGPVFDFPRATEIIHDPRIRQINGMIGSTWFAREFHMTPDEIKEIWDVDIGSSFRGYVSKGEGEDRKYVEVDSAKENPDAEDQMACVWKVWCKATRQVMVLVDGYEDFVEGPEAPRVSLERFWPLFVLTFNDVESDRDIFPPSDVRHLRHVQDEYNRSREARRQHRRANRPLYVAPQGRLSDEDLKNLGGYDDHAIIEVNGLTAGENVANLLQPVQKVPIDPALYETNSEMEDVLRTVGAQEANLGGTSGATATESSIAEQSRTTAQASNVDDLDMLLTDLAESASQLMLLELDEGTVKEIVGPGAAWPQVSAEEIAKQIQLKVKAGSSGRPNQAQDLANMERAIPYLLQIPGINPGSLAEKFGELLELDIEEMVIEGMPSIQAMNQMLARQAGGEGGGGGTSEQPRDGQSPPEQQGGEGAQNNASAQQRQAGPQPSYQQGPQR